MIHFKKTYNELLISYYLVFITGIIFLYIYGNSGSYLLMNEFHSPLLDTIMKWLTIFGDGTFAVIFALLFLLYRIRISIFLLFTWAVSGIAAQILKRFVFPDYPRPHAYFKDAGIDIYTVPGIEIHLNHSFPSGHTTTVFAIFIGLTFFVKNRLLRFILLLLACLTAYSRVYLGQHFLSDILAGSALGLLSSIIIFKFVNRWKRDWLDKAVPELFTKN